MNSRQQKFVASRLSFPGLAAWGCREVDNTVSSHSCLPWLAPAQVEQALARLAVAIGSLAQHDIEPVRVRWSFERLRIHIAVCPDGSWLALFVEHPSAAAETAVEAAVDEFVKRGT